jgi:hypothetical protein
MTGIQISSDFDLHISPQRGENGKITAGVMLGDTLHQNQALILGSYKGEFKESPYVGVGITDMLLDHDPLAWRTEIREQLELDGQTVDDVVVSNSGISVDAHY